ncbi:Pentatricopeptide repeat-containing protein [Zea mays]|jgi:pentatricopeptide repeat protein|uniref:Pentatricopeptide repeat-containing protein mitochondrial n=4 Tax=Zea mays TaxID=4577 RepID=K7V4N2_MAIZE|nr:pentatricopeptide repeat-containing protein At1g66345, mitochondrial [Zea mays]ONM29692.1 Pentatricopeptide repeat-containing protein mitochondrial [Zea mays]PWZ34660.1 Pentatricopeptide repeat-containing protein [Zea mays]|eukprot:XP_020405685.1 pentatricopeptide repeat-containing protein At1g66345, mitochondrial [Zea mays]
MAVNAGGRVVARRGGGLLGRRPASALSTATTPATPQHISHYLAHQPRATWEALSAAFPAGEMSHGHVDAVLLSLARHPHASPEPVARNALAFFHWSTAAAASSSSPPPPPSSHSLRSYCLLVHLLSRAALFRDASVLLESAISKHQSSLFSASCFLDAFFAAYEDSGTAATTRGLHLLVHAYARLRLPGEALEACRYLARRGVLPSLSAFNAALHAAQRAGSFDVAWDVFELMTQKRMYANQSTIELVIGVLSREGKLAKTVALVERIHGKKCAPGIVAHVALTLRMIEENRVEQVILLLKRMLQRNILLDDIAYSLIVHAYCHIGDAKSALEQCDDMVCRGRRLNAFVYTCLIRAHCCEGSMDKAARCLQEMLSMGTKPYDETYNHLIAGCFRQGMIKEGLAYFDNMHEEGFVLDIGSCNKMLEGLCSSGEVRKANNLLTAMMDKGLLPDKDTYLSLINGYGKVGDAQCIVNIYHEMEHRRLDPGVEVFTALIKGLCRCGNLKEAEKLFAAMKKKTLASTSDLYDMLISGYCEKRNAKRALWLYDKMMTENEKLVPSPETFMMLVRRVIKVKNTYSPDS